MENIMPKTLNISYAELVQSEVSRLISDNSFNTLIPVRCNRCGFDKIFSRRIFHVRGVRKNMRSDDGIQNIISQYFRKKLNIINIFFRENLGEFYIDSAVCQNCKSTSIVYDISLDNEIVAGYLREIDKMITNKLNKEV